MSNAGETYQELSRLTGGLRFPVCALDAYDLVFQQVVEAALRSQPSCDFALPAAPPGRVLELGEAALSYQLASAGPTGLRRVESASSCGTDAFFLDGGGVHLCPQTCAAITEGPGAQPELSFTCRSSSP